MIDVVPADFEICEHHTKVCNIPDALAIASLLVAAGGIFGRRMEVETWSLLLFAPTEVKTLFSKLFMVPRAHEIRTSLQLPPELVCLVTLYDEASWVEIVDNLVHGASGSPLQPMRRTSEIHHHIDSSGATLPWITKLYEDLHTKPAYVKNEPGYRPGLHNISHWKGTGTIGTVAQHVVAAAKYKHRKLTTTMWQAGPGDAAMTTSTTNHTGSIVSFGSDSTCHVSSPALERWQCSVFGTADSLFILSMGTRQIRVDTCQISAYSIEAGDILCVPMLRRPVRLWFADDFLLTVTPSEYAGDPPPESGSYSFEQFVKNIEQRTGWFEALLPEHLTVLLQAGLDVNRTDENGNTLLHSLCTCEEVDASYRQVNHSLVGHWTL